MAGEPTAVRPADPPTPEAAEQVQAAWSDPELAQVLDHDWGAGSYDDRWSISVDDRCTAYARDRFVGVAGEPSRPYPHSLEIGAGTGFFTLNLIRAGLIERGTVTDISPQMVRVSLAHAERLGYEVDGRVADVESLPFEDGTFDVVVGHAVIHQVPDLARALAEIARVLRPGGRLVLCGEPTRTGHRIARRLSTLTWRTTRVLTRLPGLRDWSRPAAERDESSRAAALEAVVDLHTFDPAELATLVRDSGLVGVRTTTDELTAAWWGWPVRTFEAAVAEDRLGWGWRRFAYRSWVALNRLDRRLASVVPSSLYHDVSVTAFKHR